MLYELEQGPNEKMIIEQALRGRDKIPDVIANKPRLLTGLEFYYLAFNTLSSCRGPVGMGIGRIPWTAANDYAIRYKLSEADFSRLWDLLCRMDSVYINHKANKTADTPPPAPSTAPALRETSAPAKSGPRR